MFHTWLVARWSRCRSREMPGRTRWGIERRPLVLEYLEQRLVPAAVRYPEFALPDLHPGTPTTGQNVGPAAFRGGVSGYYFTNAG